TPDAMKDSGSRLLSALSPEEKALLLVRMRDKKRVAGAVADRIEPRDRAADPAPLSFSQQRLWFLDRLMPGDAAYNIPWPVWFDGPLDVDALRAALAAVVARHEALRTTFQVAGADPVQVVAPAGHHIHAFALPRVDISALSGQAGEEAARLQREEASLPFDLGHGPLLRTVLVRLTPVRHLLMLTVHHIVSDAWSMSVLVREVAALYRGEALPPLPIQYADFAVWQRRRLSGELLERRLAHWRERLAGMSPVLDLPTDRPRPPVRSTVGDRVPLDLPRETAERVRALARESEGTAFMILLAAFLALLQRLTGQDDLSLGVPVANRDRTETAGLIGFFVNTLVLRGDLSGDPPFRELAGRVRKVALDAFAHQDLPFERLVEELRPERDPSRSPLVQASFSLQTAMEDRLPDLGPIRVEAGLPEERTVRFDLTLSLDSGFTGALLYGTALFDASTARRMAGHFLRLAAAACAAPDRRLSDLPLLTEEESAQLLREWNDTRVDGASPTLHELIAVQAERTPDAIAVDAGERLWTYGELWKRAGSLAGHLRRLGVSSEVVVGVQADRSPELVLGILAVWLAGGAYLPLDPGHPAERRAWMMEDTRATVLLAEPGTEPPPFTGAVILLDGACDEEPPPWRATDPDTLAYVIYTSGSTGRPKGVMIPHRGLSNLTARLGIFAAGPGSRILLFASPGFDASLLDLALALGSGATLCVAPGRELPGLGRLLRERRITHLHLPPSALSALGDEGPPPKLQCVILGGEPCPEPLAARWGDGRRLFNDYGPTESTVFVTVDERREGRLTTGRPIPGVEAHLLDFQLRPVPIGVHGEVCLAGAGLARGYLGLPDRTAERFVPDPYGGPGERMYRTGDLARRLPDGEIDFLGRIDHQVKVRGFRVEPGEIEAALVSHPSVREAVVVARGEGAERVLAGYVVPGEAVSPDELRPFLRAILPGHMVPASISLLDRLPLTSNGKVDRRALALRPPESRPEPAPPRSGLEETLAEIWGGLLGLERVGRDESFF
ncbi:MAG TPA: amino acid adenylation domain-containing protein, partial [Thermoanaerobaculia bacterium]|nr:amino acid adenylation domain-containing protein [Thermoanaerobaculia bacterium]